jgi:hypothetical protein
MKIVNGHIRHKDAHKLPKMPRQFVHREELGKQIAKTNRAISVINESNYTFRSIFGNNTHTVTASKLGWICSCPDYVRHNVKCKRVYAVEFYRSQTRYRNR